MKHILSYIRPFVGKMMIGFSIKFIGTIMDLFLPMLLSIILDDIVPTGDKRAIFFCGGLITRNSVSGALDFSGQAKALRHISPFLQAGAKIVATSVTEDSKGMGSFPKVGTPLYVTAAVNPDGSVVYLFTNSDTEKKQVEVVEGGRTHYVELLPNSVSTVVFGA